MAVERLAVSRPKGHCIALQAGSFPEFVVCRQNFLAAIGEGGNRLGVTPAEGSAADIPRDANQRVVVCRRTDITRHALGFARGPNFCPPRHSPGGLPTHHRPCSRAPPP